jgi:hypothetical protein
MKIYLLIFSVGLFSATASGEVVTESWLQTAGISCGGGLEVEVQGKIDTAILKRLKIGSIDSEGKYKKSEVESLLTQFRKEEKRDTYKNYVTCLLTIMDMALNNSQLPAREVILISSVAVSPLETIKRGQRFVLRPKDTIAISDHTILFTVNSVTGKRSVDYLHYTWSNSETGKGQNNKIIRQAEIIKFKEKCSIVPYKIDSKNQQASFLSNC